MFADMLSEPQKAAIASVAIAHAELEPKLDRCIIELCHLQWPHGEVLLENTRVERKLEILDKLLKIEFHGTGFPTEFKSVYEALKDLNSQRNTIIHGQWTLRSLAAALLNLGRQ